MNNAAGHEQASAGYGNDTASHDDSSWHLAVVSGGVSNPSATRMLADQITTAVGEIAGQEGYSVTASVVDLREMATEITTALVSGLIGDKLAAALETLSRAEGLIVASPVYKASPSGLLTSFFHVLDNDLLLAKPVLLAATAGTARHALVIDEQMRGLFAYFRAMAIPTSVFATADDFRDPELAERIRRAAQELVVLLACGFSRRVRDESWHRYRHGFDVTGVTDSQVEMDTDLMRLAAGGAVRRPPH